MPRTKRRRPLTVRQQIDNMALSPDHTPAWRWRLAQRLHEAKISPLDVCQAGDEHLAAIYGFQHDLAENRKKVAAQWPTLTVAHSWYRQMSDVAFEIEARILARQTITEIAQATSQNEDAIATYEHTFFDVRSKLAHPDYIRCKAIGWLAGAYDADQQLRSFIKRVAYKAGPAVLDIMLAAYRDGLDDERLAVPPDLTTVAGQLLHKAKRLLVLETLPSSLLNATVSPHILSLGEVLTAVAPMFTEADLSLCENLDNAPDEIAFVEPANELEPNLPSSWFDQPNAPISRVTKRRKLRHSRKPVSSCGAFCT